VLGISNNLIRLTIVAQQFVKPYSPFTTGIENHGNSYFIYINITTELENHGVLHIQSPPVVSLEVPFSTYTYTRHTKTPHQGILVGLFVLLVSSCEVIHAFLCVFVQNRQFLLIFARFWADFVLVL
jgi:hypothetical protein